MINVLVIYHLYVKTHKKTGLKYLGQTQKDPNKYQGSGVGWKQHLRKYRNEVRTKIVGTFQTLKELRQAALHYSKLWNVVESEQWANRIPETGGGGGGAPKHLGKWKNWPVEHARIQEALASQEARSKLPSSTLIKRLAAEWSSERDQHEFLRNYEELETLMATDPETAAKVLMQTIKDVNQHNLDTPSLRPLGVPEMLGAAAIDAFRNCGNRSYPSKLCMPQT